MVRLIIWCVVCLFTPWLLLHKSPSEEADDAPVAEQALPKKRRVTGADTIDVKAVIAELQAAQPDYIGIGNSMMFTRLGKTPEDINRLTGKKFFFIYKNGSDTPVWYLTLKNVIAASGVRPKAVLLFVRDNELTAPYAGKSEGLSSAYLKSVSLEQEPELERFMQQARATAPVVGKLGGWLASAYTFPAWQELMTRRMTDLAMDLGGGGAPKKAQRFALSARFGLEHLRGDVGSDMAQTDAQSLVTSSYADDTQSSLLPEMLKLTQGAGAKLIVFRVKRRPDATTHLPEEPAAMRDYARFLQGWLGEHGGHFFDETYDLSIQLTDYLDGDHIRPERMDWYRGYFWQRMSAAFP